MVVTSTLDLRAQSCRLGRRCAALSLALGLAALGGRADPGLGAPMPAPQVKLSSGIVQGVSLGSTTGFLGLPYAAPPVGDLRWRAPRPVAPWSNVRLADHFAPSCLQAVEPKGFGPWTHEYVVSGAVSEDCLYLNVWRPTTAAHLVPVLVWIHGGAFTSGSGSVPIYNGATLAAQGVVVVTLNYRLGALGFLAHPELSREARQTGGAPSNYGLQDIIAALQWIQQTIAQFGGDPHQVTLAGQSAGAVAVHDLIASPLAAGLFQRAIAESGLPNMSPTPTLSAAEANGQAFAREKGAASLAALRALPADQLLSASSEVRFTPVMDGVLLTAPPDTAVAQNRFHPTPMLAGVVAAEASARLQDWESSDPDLRTQLLKRTFGAAAPSIAAHFPDDSPEHRLQSLHTLMQDRSLASLLKWVDERLAAPSPPIYGYVFSHVEPGASAEKYGAFHSSEIPYVFGDLEAAPERGFKPFDLTLSETMQAYWINFVKTGDPNGPGLPSWPALEHGNLSVLEFGDTVQVRPLLPPDELRAAQRAIRDGGDPALY